MVPCGHLLANSEVLEVTLLELYVADFMIPPCHITLSPLFRNPAHPSLAELLVALSPLTLTSKPSFCIQLSLGTLVS